MRHPSAVVITAVILVCAATIIGAGSMLNSVQSAGVHEGKRQTHREAPGLSRAQLRKLLTIALDEAAKMLSVRHHTPSQGHMPLLNHSLALTEANTDPFVSTPGSTSLLFGFNPQTLAFADSELLELDTTTARTGLASLSALDESRDPSSNWHAIPNSSPSSWGGGGWVASFDGTKSPTATPTLSAVPEPASIGLILSGLILAAITAPLRRFSRPRAVNQL